MNHPASSLATPAASAAVARPEAVNAAIDHATALVAGELHEVEARLTDLLQSSIAIIPE
ncbi:MAG: hypothetical protein H0T76_24525, partial [Nannocystis sp.]|nr:hypothetical protein [Nannocystis sp.]